MTASHLVALRGCIDARMHQAGHILCGHRHIAQDLQNRHCLSDFLMELRTGEADQHFANRLMDRRECPANIFFQGVVQGDGGRQPTDGSGWPPGRGLPDLQSEYPG